MFTLQNLASLILVFILVYLLLKYVIFKDTEGGYEPPKKIPQEDKKEVPKNPKFEVMPDYCPTSPNLNAGVSTERELPNRYKEWSINDINFLHDNSNKSNDWLARKLGRSVRSVSVMKHKEKIYGVRPKYKRWTEEDVAFLMDNLVKMTTEELAQQLGRTSLSIASKLNRIRINCKDD